MNEIEFIDNNLEIIQTITTNNTSNNISNVSGTDAVDVTNTANLANIEKYDIVSLQFYLMYHLLLRTKNENQFAVCLSEFLESINAVDFIRIDNLKSLIFNLKSENLTRSYKLSLLAYTKSELSTQAQSMFEPLFQLTNETKYDIAFIVSTLSTLKCDLTYIEAFKPVPQTLKILGNDQVVLNKSTKQTTSNDAWYYETRLDILNRFEYLRNYFGLNKLQNFKIKNVTYDEVYNMQFKKLAKYHNKIIEKIKKHIKKGITLCETFIDVEKTFVISLYPSDNKYINMLRDDSDNSADNNIDDNIVDIQDFIKNDSVEDYISDDNKNKLDFCSDVDSDISLESSSDIDLDIDLDFNKEFGQIFTNSNNSLVCSVGIDIGQFDSNQTSNVNFLEFDTPGIQNTQDMQTIPLDEQL